MRHVHRYEKTEWGKRKAVIWRCTLEGCTHYMHPEMIKGNPCVCYKCGREFILTPDKLSRKKPTCDFCLGIQVEVVAPVEIPVVKEAPKKAVQPEIDLSDIDLAELLKGL